MYDRKRLDRERLEIYFVQLLLAYHPFLMIGGVLLLAYALVIMFQSILLGSIFVLVAAIPLSLAFSYPVVVLTARLGAWIATLGRKNE
jgi:pheromone shutdown protein TraB